VESPKNSVVSEIPGARSTVETLRDVGLQVALTTGFSPATREALIHVLGLGGPVRNSRLAGRRRPRSARAGHVVVVCAEVPNHRGGFFDGGGRHRLRHGGRSARGRRLLRGRSLRNDDGTVSLPTAPTTSSIQSSTARFRSLGLLMVRAGPELLSGVEQFRCGDSWRSDRR